MVVGVVGVGAKKKDPSLSRNGPLERGLGAFFAIESDLRIDPRAVKGEAFVVRCRLSPRDSNMQPNPFRSEHVALVERAAS